MNEVNLPAIEPVTDDVRVALSMPPRLRIDDAMCASSNKTAAALERIAAALERRANEPKEDV